MDKKLKVFVSYAHKNENYISEITKRLKILQHSRLITDYWCDREIVAGDHWKDVIREQIATSHLFLLLVDTNFLASDFIQEEELPFIFRCCGNNHGMVVPIIVEDCPWKSSPLNELQAIILTQKEKSAGDWKKAFDEIESCCKKLELLPSESSATSNPSFSLDRFLNAISHLTIPAIGQTKFINSILKSLARGESVVIAGYAGLGKSIVAGNILKKFTDFHREYLFHYFKLPAHSDPPALIRSVLQELLITHFPYTPESEDINYLFNRIVAFMQKRTVFLFFDDANDSAALEMILQFKNRLHNSIMLITSQHENWLGLPSISIQHIEGLGETESLKLFQKYYKSPLNPGQLVHLQKFIQQVEGNPLLIECYAQECCASGFPTNDTILNNSIDRTWTELKSRFKKRYDQLPEVSQKVLSLTGILEKTQISRELAISAANCTAEDIHHLMDQGFVHGTQMRDGFYVPTIYRECCKRIVAESSHHESIQSLVSGIMRYFSGLLYQHQEDLLDAEWPNIVKIIDEHILNNKNVLEFIDQAIGDHLDDPIGYLPKRQHISFLLARCDLIKDRLDGVSSDVAARIEKNLGIFNYLHGHYKAAKVSCLNAKQRYVKDGNQAGEIVCNYLLGQIDEDQSNFSTAKEFYQEALDSALAAQPPDKLLIGLGYYHLGCVQYHQGYYAEAHRDLNRASVDEAVDQHLATRINRRIGSVLIGLGAYEDAIWYFSRLEDTLKTLGRRRDFARLSNKQALLYLHLKNWAEAKAKIDEAFRIFHDEMEDTRRMGSTQLLLSIWYVSQNKMEEALEQCKISLSFARKTRSFYGIARAYEEMANILELSNSQQAEITEMRRQAYCYYSTIRHQKIANESMETYCRTNAKPPHPIKAIIFDLIDTLTICSHEQYKVNHENYARSLHVDRACFDEVWMDSRELAQKGSFQNTEKRMDWVMRKLNLRPSSAQISEFANREENYWIQNVKWLPDAQRVLKRLREKGIKIAILANGPAALKGLKHSLRLSSLVDTLLLSCDSGFLKPDKGSYQQALKSMGLEFKAGNCVFVGDGTDKELNGARECGLYTIRMKKERPPYLTWENESTDWDWEVNNLQELLDLLRI